MTAGAPSTAARCSSPRACRLLTEAVAMYTKIGMPKHIEMVEAMLGEV